MKTLLTAFILCISLVSKAAMPRQGINEKAAETFNSIFKDAADIRWVYKKHYAVAGFLIKGIHVKATFDDLGKLVQTIRYYKENNLPPMILNNIRKIYTRHEIFGVTEVSNRSQINYVVTIRDKKNYYYVNATDNGSIVLLKKYKRADISG